MEAAVVHEREGAPRVAHLLAGHQLAAAAALAFAGGDVRLAGLICQVSAPVSAFPQAWP